LDKGLSGQTASQPGRCFEKELNFHPPFVLCAKMLMAAAKAGAVFHATEIYTPLDGRQAKYIMAARIIFAHTSKL
jgi:hypothetical protein